MFAELRKLQNGNREEGFTLIELLVVILIIGILSAIAIPAFLNQRKAAVDAAVEADVNNAAKSVEAWMVKNPMSPVPNQVLTPNSEEESFASGDNTGAGNGNLAFITLNVPSIVAMALPGDTAKLSSGTAVVIKGTENIGEYCVYGVNKGGDASSRDAGVVRDSSGSACEYDGTEQSIPEEIIAILGSTFSGGTSDAGTEEGHAGIAITNAGYMSEPVDGPSNEPYRVIYSMDNSTRIVTYDVEFNYEPGYGTGYQYSGTGTLLFGAPDHNMYVDFTATNGKAHGTFHVPESNDWFVYVQGTFLSSTGENFDMYYQ